MSQYFRSISNRLGLGAMRPVIVFIGAVLPVVSHAASMDDMQVNGFFTQGVFVSDDNNLYGESSSVSADFREIAVNASWQMTSDWVLAGQLMSRRAGAVDGGAIQIDYALADYRLLDNENGRLGLKIGRIKNPFGFYNETRDVAFTRPSVMLPQSMYFDIARDLELSSDGLSLYASRNIDSGWVDVDWLVGAPKQEASVEYAYLSNDWPGEFSDGAGTMLRTMYNSSSQTFRLGATLAYFKLGYDADEAALSALSAQDQAVAPKDGDMDLSVAFISAQYNLERWSFTSEYGRQRISWGELEGAFAYDPVNTAESLYVQAEYRINHQWSLVARYDRLYLDLDDRDGKKTEALYGKPAHTQYAKDLTLGVGWQPTPEWLLRGEVHHVHGTGWLPEQDNPDQSALKRDWNLLTLQATYRF